jgi:glycosyltransferase involved in cell wall biosynthesis
VCPLASLEQSVLMVGLPWLRTGTGAIFASQLSFARAEGYAPIFVAVPFGAKDNLKSAIWDRFEAQKSYLPVSEIHSTTFTRKVRRGGAIGRFIARRRGRDTVDWYLKVSGAAPLTPAIKQSLLIKPVRYIIANHIYTLGFAHKVQAFLQSKGFFPPLIVVTHDVQSHIISDNSIKNPWTGKPDAFENLLLSELRVLKTADALIHVSQDDLYFFRERLPEIPQYLVLPTVDAKPTLNDVEQTNDLLFVGSDHVANFHAIEWYFQSVLPCFRKQVPSLEVVGRIDHILKHRTPDLWSRYQDHFKGNVPSTDPYYARARAVIIPMQSGRGISIKTIEACAKGMPIVGTSHAFRGMPRRDVIDAGLRPYDTPASFADAIEHVLEEPSAHSAASRKLYQRLFSLESYQNNMRRTLSEIEAQHRLRQSGRTIRLVSTISKAAAPNLNRPPRMDT